VNSRDVDSDKDGSIDGLLYLVGARRFHHGSLLTTEFLAEGVLTSDLNVAADLGVREMANLGMLSPFGGIRYEMRDGQHYSSDTEKTRADEDKGFWLEYGLGVGPVAFVVSHSLESGESIGALSLALNY
jgi:hypothetical protein